MSILQGKGNIFVSSRKVLGKAILCIGKSLNEILRIEKRE